MAVERSIAEPDGAPLPRKNGELVFAAPWEGRAFGMAIALHQAGHFEWDAFRDRLVDEIAHHDQAAYYDTWLSALEEVVVERALVDPSELAARTEANRTGAREDVF